jgi:serine/threonine-protein kinase RsbW
MPGATQKNHTPKTLTIPSDLKWMPRVVAEVERVVKEVGFDEESGDFLAIATTEAVNNAIVHGNRQDISKKVRIRFEKNPEKLTISISDEGAGFDPENCEDPTNPENISKGSGRGIFIVRQLMDEVNISTTSHGTTVVLVKYVERKKH